MTNLKEAIERVQVLEGVHSILCSIQGVNSPEALKRSEGIKLIKESINMIEELEGRIDSIVDIDKTCSEIEKFIS